MSNQARFRHANCMQRVTLSSFFLPWIQPCWSMSTWDKHASVERLVTHNEIGHNTNSRAYMKTITYWNLIWDVRMWDVRCENHSTGWATRCIKNWVQTDKYFMTNSIHKQQVESFVKQNMPVQWKIYLQFQRYILPKRVDGPGVSAKNANLQMKCRLNFHFVKILK